MYKYINAEKLTKFLASEMENIAFKNVDGCYSEMDYWYNEGKRVATLALFRYVHSEMDEDTGEWIKELAE